MEPSTYEVTRDRIAELEAEITIHGNAAREAMIEQGSLFESFAGDKATIKALCEETGVAFKAADHRIKIASRLARHPQSAEIKALLAEQSDINVSFDSLASLLGDDDALTVLGMLITEARAGNKGRVTRDAVRRARGNVPGTVGSIEATAARMLLDPAYAEQLVEKLNQTEEGQALLAELLSVFDRLLAKQPRAKSSSSSGENKDGLPFAIHKDGSATRALSEALVGMQPLSDENQRLLDEHVDNQVRRYQMIKAQVHGDDVDAELALLLGGE